MSESRLSFFSVLFLLAAAPLYSSNSKPQGKKVVLRGYLVDIACVNDRASEGADLGEVHTKKCLQMPACERSGYAVMDAQDHVYKFDANGNTIAKNLIAATDKDKDWQIVVSGRLQGDQLTVAKLQLRK